MTHTSLTLVLLYKLISSSNLARSVEVQRFSWSWLKCACACLVSFNYVHICPYGSVKVARLFSRLFSLQTAQKLHLVGNKLRRNQPHLLLHDCFSPELKMKPSPAQKLFSDWLLPRLDLTRGLVCSQKAIRAEDSNRKGRSLWKKMHNLLHLVILLTAP